MDKSNNKNEMLEAALYYYKKLGWSILPVGVDKKPLIPWKKYQTERLTEEEVTYWFSKPEVYIAVVTGSISGIGIVDIDIDPYTKKFSYAGIDLMKQLPSTWISVTGGNGYHYIYQLTKPIASYIGIKDKVDIRAEGAYIVLPPSLHESGKEYEFKIAPWDELEEIAEFPYELFNDYFEQKEHIKTNDVTNNKKITKGKRNSTLMSYAGTIFKQLPDRPDLARLCIKGLNQTMCDPPLPDEELERTILTSAPKYHPAETEARVRNFNPVTADELFTVQYEDSKWLIESLVPESSITFLVGNPASFKTWLTLNVSLSVATGNKLFDTFGTSKHNVLIIDEENQGRTIQERLKLLGYDSGLPIYISTPSNFKLDDKSADEVITFAKEKDIKLVIFDSFIRIHNMDENDAKQMAQVASYLKKLTIAGLTVVCTHHNRKQTISSNNPAQTIRGSSDILASVDCMLAVERKGSELIVKQVKLRQAEEIKPFKLNIENSIDRLYLKYAGEVDESTSKVEECKSFIESVLVDKQTNKTQLLKAIQEAGFSGGESSFETALNQLIKAKVIYTKRGKGNATLCSLKPVEERDG